jgi:hypothetical protein
MVPKQIENELHDAVPPFFRVRDARHRFVSGRFRRVGEMVSCAPAVVVDPCEAAPYRTGSGWRLTPEGSDDRDGWRGKGESPALGKTGLSGVDV